MMIPFIPQPKTSKKKAHPPKTRPWISRQIFIALVSQTRPFLGWSEADPIYNITEGPDPRIGVAPTAVTTFFLGGKTHGNSWEIMGLLGIPGNSVI